MGDRPGRVRGAVEGSPPDAWVALAGPWMRRSLWAGYTLSGLAYLVRIGEAVRAARAPGAAPAFFGASGLAPEVFYLLGTAHWITVGISRAGSPARRAVSTALAGLHILLFAVRVWLGPMLWALGSVG